MQRGGEKYASQEESQEEDSEEEKEIVSL